MYSTYAELRDARGMTDYRVAKETGITYQTLLGWKKGEYTPKVDKMVILSEFFGVPLKTLLEK